MTLEQLKVYAKVVQCGSFTAAADLLGTHKSYVSRVVAQLETDLGLQLLERTTRRLSVTELGQEVYGRAVGILEAVDDTARLVQRTRGQPSGLLRLTCGVEFGLLAVGAWVDEYLALHPGTSAEVEHTSRVIDLVHEGFDLAIRIGPVPASRLVARPLGELAYGLFASPGYAAEAGLPKSPAQLREHRLVMFSGGALRRGWTLQRPGDTGDAPVKIDGPARLRVNNSLAVRDAVSKGLGIGLLPLLIAADALADGRLRPVLPAWQPPAVPVYAVYPSNRYLAPKVRAFIDLALLRFPQSTQQAANALARATPRRTSRAQPGDKPGHARRAGTI